MDTIQYTKIYWNIRSQQSYLNRCDQIAVGPKPETAKVSQSTFD